MIQGRRHNPELCNPPEAASSFSTKKEVSTNRPVSKQSDSLASISEKFITYKAVRSQVAMVVVNLETGQWSIRRFLGRKERPLRIRADSNCVRPQQSIGRRI